MSSSHKALRLTLLIAAAIGLCLSASAFAQGLTVLPVTLQLAPGQATATFTVINQSDTDTSFQVRGFAWTQPDGTNRLVNTDDIIASPPLGTIPANTSQVVRMVVRHPPQGHEATYRILLDQIPPPALPGTIRIALRLSIPVFAEPQARVAPHVTWHVENSGNESFLVGVNDGSRHEVIRNISLIADGGAALKVEANASPYILPGATRRWRIVEANRLAGSARLHLSALADSGTIDQPIAVTAK